MGPSHRFVINHGSYHQVLFRRTLDAQVTTVLNRLTVGRINLLIGVGVILARTIGRTPRPIVRIINRIFQRSTSRVLVSRADRVLNYRVTTLVIISRGSIPAVNLILIRRRVQGVV